MAVDVLDVFRMYLRYLERAKPDFPAELDDEGISVATRALSEGLILVRRQPAVVGVMILVSLDTHIYFSMTSPT